MSKVSKTNLVDLILAYDVTLGNLENQVRQVKESQREAEKSLLSMMEADEEQSFTDEYGRKVSRDDLMKLTVRADDKDLWFDWIESVGRGDLIKTAINKRSLNAIVEKSIRGDEKFPVPSFLDLEKDLFFIPKVAIKQGARSLRKMASESISSDFSKKDHEF